MDLDAFIKKYGNTLEKHMGEKLIGQTITNVYDPQVSDVVRGYIQYGKRPLLAVHHRFADETEKNQEAEDANRAKPFVEYATEHFVDEEIIKVDIHEAGGQYYVGLYVNDANESGEDVLHVPLHITTDQVDEEGNPDVKEIPIWITRVLGLTPPEKEVQQQEVLEPEEQEE